MSLVLRLCHTAIIVLALILAGTVSTVSAQSTPEATTAPAPEPTGVFFDAEEIAAFVEMFSDEPLTGGQVAPRFSKFVNDDVFLFLQFDSIDAPTELRYVGIGIKSVFCAEAQPDPSFTHFHRYDAPEYGDGHGGDPGAQGYWMTWAAVNSFEARDGRVIEPGIDYEFSPTPPPDCDDSVPEPDFTPADAHVLSLEEVAELAALFNDPILIGGQQPPRLSKWVNEGNIIFLQFDSLDEPTAVNYIGVSTVGVFCAETRLSEDFTHYHRFLAAQYGEGHAGEPGEGDGYWLLWIAANDIEARDGRLISPGVDREFSPTPPPECGDLVENESASAAPEGAAALAVGAFEWGFEPSHIHAIAGADVTIDVTNTGSELHTFTIPDLGVDTGTINPGESISVSFTAPSAGDYAFICTYAGHEEAGMTGTLAVA
jgi:plastocyanin